MLDSLAHPVARRIVIVVHKAAGNPCQGTLYHPGYLTVDVPPDGIVAHPFAALQIADGVVAVVSCHLVFDIPVHIVVAVVGGAAVIAVPDVIQPVGAGGVHIGEAVLQRVGA
jgi:hypothetical protein